MQYEEGDSVLNRQVNVRISEKDFEILKKMAEDQDRTPTYIVRRAIISYLDSLKKVTA